jgi:hypothetical protein
MLSLVQKGEPMRSLTATLSLVVLCAVSFVGCKKKEETQSQPPASSQPASTSTTAPADNPATTQTSTTQPSGTQPAGTPPAATPAPANPKQKISIKPGQLTLADRNSIAGTWRGTTSSSHYRYIFHFNSDGLGSLELPQYNSQQPVSISKMGEIVEIDTNNKNVKFVGKINGRKMTLKAGFEDLELTKD